MSGIEVKSGLVLSWKSIQLQFCQPSYVHVMPGKCTAMPKDLKHFHLNYPRTLLNIMWQDKILNTEVLKKTGMQSTHTLLKLAQLTWTGHVTRLPDEWLPKEAQGGQKKHYNDSRKASLKNFNISPGNILHIMLPQQNVKKSVCEAERKCKERKARAKES